ncbi:MAG TPA: MBL fold metallo-hydrolase [Methylotenera sp.]|nr:MBL fold metallo-hydrolase [Methylotenera sp.]
MAKYTKTTFWLRFHTLSRLYVSFVFLPVILFSILSPSHAATGEYAIEQVKGNVYRFIDDRHRSLIVVGTHNILLVDTLNKPASVWLKSALEQRFHLPVKYVVYSHNHSDHIYGAEIFKSSNTTFIAHKLAYQDIVNTKAATVTPDITFTDKMQITLDDHEIELRYHGPNDGRGSISVLVLPEKVLFAADWIVIGRMPWQKLWSYDIQGVINSTQEVMQLDFDTFVGGHGNIGTKFEVGRYLNYMSQLYTAVIKSTLAGMTLEEMKKTIRLDEYKDLDFYEEWLPLNIEGVYKRLSEESGLGWRSN